MRKLKADESGRAPALSHPRLKPEEGAGGGVGLL